MKIVISLVLVMLLFGSLLAGCGKSEDEETVDETETDIDEEFSRGGLSDTYKYTIISSMASGESHSAKIWVKDDKYKVETTSIFQNEEEEATAFIVKEGYSYMYNPQENSAMKMPGEGMAGMYLAFNVFFTGYYTEYSSESKVLAEMCAACALNPQCLSWEITGHDTISGYDCTIFEMTGTEVNNVKIWIAIDLGYVLKYEVVLPTGINTIEFKDVEVDIDIPDSVFDLPAGMEIMEY
ncbi:MAG: hypothetical protein PHQ86_01310 [Dehalococcoidales bacterium]|nr:hypothetical protein [Dehalococcoidales bacterium]